MKLLIEHFSSRCVLVVEDDDANLAVTKELLEEAGLFVEVAVNGVQAVRLAAQKHFDLILMDVIMPVLDGLGATRQIRELSQCADVPIVALTACAFAEDKFQCLNSGMNGFLAKPVMAETLFGAVLHWLKSTNSLHLDSIT